MIIQELNLNLIPTGDPIVLHVSQGDKGSWRFYFHPMLNGERYVWNNATFKLHGTKPNGETFDKSCGFLGVQRVHCDLDADMTDVAGDVYCNLVMTEGGDRTGTQAFILRVQKEAK